MQITKGLIAPQSYLDADPEVIAVLVNGCGPGGWKVDLVPDELLGLDISEACNIHDFMYTIGTCEADKKEADETFRKNLYTLIDQSTGFIESIIKYDRMLKADAYYEAVHLFGNSAFWTGKNKSEGV